MNNEADKSPFMPIMISNKMMKKLKGIRSQLDMRDEAVEAKEKVQKAELSAYESNGIWARRGYGDFSSSNWLGANWIDAAARLPARVEEPVKPKCTHLCICGGVCTWCNEIVSSFPIPNVAVEPVNRTEPWKEDFEDPQEADRCSSRWRNVQCRRWKGHSARLHWAVGGNTEWADEESDAAPPSPIPSATASEDVGPAGLPIRPAMAFGVEQSYSERLIAEEVNEYADAIERQLLEARKEIAELVEKNRKFDALVTKQDEILELARLKGGE